MKLREVGWDVRGIRDDGAGLLVLGICVFRHAALAVGLEFEFALDVALGRVGSQRLGGALPVQAPWDLGSGAWWFGHGGGNRAWFALNEVFLETS